MAYNTYLIIKLGRENWLPWGWQRHSPVDTTENVKAGGARWRVSITLLYQTFSAKPDCSNSHVEQLGIDIEVYAFDPSLVGRVLGRAFVVRHEMDQVLQFCSDFLSLPFPLFKLWAPMSLCNSWIMHAWQTYGGWRFYLGGSCEMPNVCKTAVRKS